MPSGEAHVRLSFTELPHFHRLVAFVEEVEDYARLTSDDHLQRMINEMRTDLAEMFELMHCGRLTINARLVDHHWPPRWIGPWLGVKIAPRAGERRHTPHMLNLHVQYHCLADDGHNSGVQAGVLIYSARRDGQPRIRFGRNWWSPRYTQRPLGWGWWVS